MSLASVKEAQDELSKRLNPKTLEFLKNRGLSKARDDARSKEDAKAARPRADGRHNERKSGAKRRRKRRRGRKQ